MRVAILSLLLALGAIVAPSVAQSLPAEKKAVLVFDIRMDKLNASPLGKQMKFHELLSDAQKKAEEKSGKKGGADPSKLVRLYGAISAPKSLAELQSMRPDKKTPFEFFMRAKYQDAESAKVALQDSLAKDNETIQRNGRTFYPATEGGTMPPGTMLQQVDDTTLEMATESYAFHVDRKVFSDNLQKAWDKSPEEAVRVAMDIKGAQSLVAGLIEESKKSAPEAAATKYLDLIDNISHMGISIDLTGANLLTIQSTAVDSAQGTELKGELDTLLSQAQAKGKQALPMIGQIMPSMKPVAESIIGSLVAKSEGNDVSIVIPKPEGFEAAVGEHSQIISALLFGGGGPGAGPGAPPTGGPSGAPAGGSDNKGGQ